MSAVPPSTDPMSSTTSAVSVWSTRRLSAMASGAPSRSDHWRAFLANPASGATTTRSGRPLASMASQSDGHGVEVVDRHLEEPLDLGRVQVQGDDPVHARRLDRVGAHPGPDRDAGFVLLVALGVAQVGDHGRDRRGAGPLDRVDPEQQLHEVVVGREGGALDEEDVATADVLEHPDEEVPLGEPERLAAARARTRGTPRWRCPACRLADPARSTKSSAMWPSYRRGRCPDGLRS